MTTTLYVKFISKNEIEYAPLCKDGIVNYNLDIERMKADGYKPLVEVPRPIPSDSYIEYKEYKTKVQEILVQPTPEERLVAAKAKKQQENEDACNLTRSIAVFDIEIQGKYCVFDTSTQTQADLQTAYLYTFSGASYPNWVTNNWVKLDLTHEDVEAIFEVFFARVSPLYSKELEYKDQIEACTTIEEVEAIIIDYSTVSFN